MQWLLKKYFTIICNKWTKYSIVYNYLSAAQKYSQMIWTKFKVTQIFILPYLFTSLTANLPNAHDPAMFYTKLPRKWKDKEPKFLRWWYNYLLFIMIYRALLNTVTVINRKSKQTSSAPWFTIVDLRFASHWWGERQLFSNNTSK